MSQRKDSLPGGWLGAAMAKLGLTPSSCRSGQNGKAYEELAAAWLKARQCQIVTTNYRCRHGEIDIIARHGELWLFVEVRYRRQHSFGGPLASVTAQKQRRLQLAARHFAGRLGYWPDCRFDVLALSGPPQALQIEWIKNAF